LVTLEQQQLLPFNSKYNCWNGVNHFDIFVGALTGNASTATALAAGRTFLEQVKLRLLQVL
jgi:hypothetical protein